MTDRSSWFRFHSFRKPLHVPFQLDSSVIPSSLQCGDCIQEEKEVQWRKRADLEEGFRTTVSFGSTTCLGTMVGVQGVMSTE